MRWCGIADKALVLRIFLVMFSRESQAYQTTVVSWGIFFVVRGMHFGMKLRLVLVLEDGACLF